MIKLSFTGDVMCEGSRLKDYCDLTGNYCFEEVFESLKSVFDGSDFVVANLETPLAGEKLGYTSKNYSFNTPKTLAVALKHAGVDMVTTANNHVLDRGVAGLKATIAALDEIGLDHTGSFAEPKDNVPFVIELEGIRIAFLSYTYGTEACFNGHYLTNDQQWMVNLLRNQELKNPVRRYFLTSPAIPAKGFRFFYRILAPQKAKMDVSQRKEKEAEQLLKLRRDIDWCKHNADFSIMLPHIGGQFSPVPTEYTERIVNLCLSEGMDAVIANHEHIIHPMKMQQSKPVAYCLGNLTSDYGIRRQPLNSLAEYSAVLHIYIDNKQLIKVSVSLIKSVEKDGKIVCVPVAELFERISGQERDVLLEEAQRCVNTLLRASDRPFLIRNEYVMFERQI